MANTFKSIFLSTFLLTERRACIQGFNVCHEPLFFSYFLINALSWASSSISEILHKCKKIKGSKFLSSLDSPWEKFISWGNFSFLQDVAYFNIVDIHFFFSGFLRNCTNCVHNCEDHSSFVSSWWRSVIRFVNCKSSVINKTATAVARFLQASLIFNFESRVTELLAGRDSKKVQVEVYLRILQNRTLFYTK